MLSVSGAVSREGNRDCGFCDFRSDFVDFLVRNRGELHHNADGAAVKEKKMEYASRIFGGAYFLYRRFDANKNGSERCYK